MRFCDFLKTHTNENDTWLTEKWVEYEIRKKFGIYAPITQGIADINTVYENDGWVYVIGFENHYKIGYSAHIKNRLKSYVKTPPFDYILYGAHQIGVKALKMEQFIHSLFNDERRRGEWFFTSQANPYEISKVLSKLSINKTSLSSYKQLHDMGFTMGTIRSIYDSGFNDMDFINKKARITKKLGYISVGSFLCMRQHENKK